MARIAIFFFIFSAFILSFISLEHAKNVDADALKPLEINLYRRQIISIAKLVNSNKTIEESADIVASECEKELLEISEYFSKKVKSKIKKFHPSEKEIVEIVEKYKEESMRDSRAAVRENAIALLTMQRKLYPQIRTHD